MPISEFKAEESLGKARNYLKKFSFAPTQAPEMVSTGISRLLENLASFPDKITNEDVHYIASYCQYLSQQKDTTTFSKHLLVPLVWALASSEYHSILKNEFAALIDKREDIAAAIIMEAELVWMLSINREDAPRKQRIGILLEKVNKAYSSEKDQQTISQNLARDILAYEKDTLQWQDGSRREDIFKTLTDLATGKTGGILGNPPDADAGIFKSNLKKSLDNLSSQNINIVSSDIVSENSNEEKNADYFVNYCQKLSSSEEKTDEAKLSELIWALSQSNLHTRELSDAFIELLNKRIDILQQIIETPRLLAGLSIKVGQEEVEVNRKERLDKLLAVYINQPQSTREQWIQNLVANLKTQQDYLPVIRGSLTSFMRKGITTTTPADQLRIPLENELKKQGIPLPSKQKIFNNLNVFKKVKRAINIDQELNAFKDGIQAFNQEKNFSPLTVAMLFDKSFSKTQKDSTHFIKRQNEFIKNLANTQGGYISVSNFKKLVSVLTKAKNDNFWYASSCFSSQFLNIRNAYSSKQRAELIELMFEHARNNSIDADLTEKILRFIAEQVSMFQQQTAGYAISDILPILFRKDNFALLETNTFSAHVQTIFKEVFSRSLHDSLYRVGREADWITLCNVLGVNWNEFPSSIPESVKLTPQQTDQWQNEWPTLTTKAEEDKKENAIKLSYPKSPNGYRALWARMNQTYPQNNFNWWWAIWRQFSKNEDLKPQYRSAILLESSDPVKKNKTQKNGYEQTRHVEDDSYGGIMKATLSSPDVKQLNQTTYDKDNYLKLASNQRANFLQPLSDNQLINIYHHLEHADIPSFIKAVESNKIVTLYLNSFEKCDKLELLTHLTNERLNELYKDLSQKYPNDVGVFVPLLTSHQLLEIYYTGLIGTGEDGKVVRQDNISFLRNLYENSSNDIDNKFINLYKKISPYIDANSTTTSPTTKKVMLWDFKENIELLYIEKKRPVPKDIAFTDEERKERRKVRYEQRKLTEKGVTQQDSQGYASIPTKATN